MQAVVIQPLFCRYGTVPLSGLHEGLQAQTVALQAPHVFLRSLAQILVSVLREKVQNQRQLEAAHQAVPRSGA